jgi:hypothetical protein
MSTGQRLSPEGSGRGKRNPYRCVDLHVENGNDLSLETNAGGKKGVSRTL